MKAIIFAAGLGTRLKPLTDTMPKALVPIEGIPLLEHIIMKLSSSGFDEIIINVHHFADQIIAFVREKNNFGIRIEFSDEREKLLDTGGGIKKAGWFFDDGKPFLVHNVDILSNVNLSQLYQHHLNSKTSATLLVSHRQTNRHLLFDENHLLKGWINEATGETKPLGAEIDPARFQKYAFSGIHIISPEFLKKMENREETFSIIDFYLNASSSSSIAGYYDENLKMIDVGKIYSLTEAEKFIRCGFYAF